MDYAERMDESVTGIVTTLCNHSFHCTCLKAWHDTSCPVCRHTSKPEAANECTVCGTSDGLWICLICGFIGCGRYLDRHSYQHFVETQHTYAMDLQSRRVWDYVGDNYVHRLIQSTADGKPVELPGASGATAAEEKVDALTLEYTYLLTSQLESQRRFYTEQLAQCEADHKYGCPGNSAGIGERQLNHVTAFGCAGHRLQRWSSAWRGWRGSIGGAARCTSGWSRFRRR